MTGCGVVVPVVPTPPSKPLAEDEVTVRLLVEPGEVEAVVVTGVEVEVLVELETRVVLAVAALPRAGA